MPELSDKPAVVYPGILEIDPYKQGEFRVDGAMEPLKLSSNENPFGASPAAIAALQEASLHTHRYPDGNCTILRKTIAKHYALDAKKIVCGAGSDELIALLCQAYAGPGDEVIYSQYGFLMYPISTLRVGAVPVIAAESKLRTDVDNILKCVTDKTKIVFIANPNNPTGSYITKDEAKRLRDGLPGHVLLVIDAAYAEYVEEEDYEDGAGLVETTQNTVMTRTFSKIYGLSSLRLGWAYSPPEITDVLNRVRGPFNVSDAAQAAGVAAIKDSDFIAHAKAHNTTWLTWMTEKCAALGLIPHPSSANFLLVTFPGGREQAHAANVFLKQKGIIIRAMDSYGLPDALRITIGLEAENKAVAAALKEFMG